MPLPSLEHYLSAQGGLKPVVEKALKLDELSRFCAAILPPELASQVQVANLRHDHLVLLAANPAAAAKLRLYAKTLGDHLLTHGSEGIVVSVKVQPNFSRKKHGAVHHKPVLSAAALEQLASLYTNLRDSPVRRALGRLLAHHGALATRQPADARPRTGEEPKPRQTGRT